MTRVMAFGTFDSLHPGHIEALKQAKSLGNELVVIVSRDITVSKYKNHKAKFSEQQRLKHVKNLGIATKVLLGGFNDKLEVVRKLKPDVVALGYDQNLFVNDLKQIIKNKKVKIVRLKKYHPDIFKSSKLQNKKLPTIIGVWGILIKDHKIYLQERIDPRPKFNNLWEFPGGGLERGETLENCLTREVKEETGYTAKIIYEIPTWYRDYTKKSAETNCYQVYAKVFVCKISGGKFARDRSEVNQGKWFSLGDAINLKPAFRLNAKILKENIKYINKFLN